MSEHPVVDADGHVEEDLDAITALLPEAMRPYAPRFLFEGRRGHVGFLLEGRVWRSRFPFPHGRENATAAGGERREGGRDPEIRVQELDREGITSAVLFPSVALLFGWYEHADIVDAMCRAYNDWLASYCAVDPDRLLGVAVLPQHDPQLAATELERCVETHGFVGGMIRPNAIGGTTVDDPSFDVLWETAAGLDVPITLHEAYNHGIDAVGVERMHTYVANHISSHVFEQMTAMMVLTIAGVFERFPGLRLGFFEAGCGWAPTWEDRIVEHFELAPGDFRGGDPADVLSSRAWVTFEIDEPALASTLELGWADQVCFASDYPHFDAIFPGAVEAVRDRGLGAELERKVLLDNAQAFFGERLVRAVDRAHASRG